MCFCQRSHVIVRLDGDYSDGKKKNGKESNIAILVLILVYFWRCIAQTCLLSHTPAHSHTDTHRRKTALNKRTHAGASVPSNKSQTVRFSRSQAKAAVEPDPVKLQRLGAAPLKRTRVGSPLPVPLKLPYNR